MKKPSRKKSSAGRSKASAAKKSASATVRNTSLSISSVPLKASLRERVIRALDRSLENASVETLTQALAAATDTGSAAQLLSGTAGTDEAVRSLDPLAAATMRGAAMKVDLLQQAGGALQTAEVAEFLGISRQAIAKRVQRGTLLAFTDASGNLLFPSLQFTSSGVVDGLPEVLAAFNVESPWTRLSVLVDTDPSLGNRRVIDALKEGDLEDVLDVVRSFGA